MNEREKLDSFLTDLQNLMDKYNAELGGCGCCGSPSIHSRMFDLNHVRATAESVKYDEAEG